MPPKKARGGPSKRTAKQKPSESHATDKVCNTDLTPLEQYRRAENSLVEAGWELARKLTDRGLPYPPHVVPATCEEMPAGCITSEDPDFLPYHEACVGYRLAREKFLATLPASPEMPIGWEGEGWKRSFHLMSDVAEWACEELERVQALRTYPELAVSFGATAINNFFRILDRLTEYSRPPRPLAPSSPIEAEAALSDLCHWAIRTAIEHRENIFPRLPLVGAKDARAAAHKAGQPERLFEVLDEIEANAEELDGAGLNRDYSKFTLQWAVLNDSLRKLTGYLERFGANPPAELQPIVDLQLLVREVLAIAMKAISSGRLQASLPASDRERPTAAAIDRSIYAGPRSPSEWAKLFSMSVKTFARRRNVDKSIRAIALTEKQILVHKDDVATFTKRTRIGH